MLKELSMLRLTSWPLEFRILVTSILTLSNIKETSNVVIECENKAGNAHREIGILGLKSESTSQIEINSNSRLLFLIDKDKY